MIKKILTLLLFSQLAQSQINNYNQITKDNFYNIGGYSFTQEFFPNGLQAGAYEINGPNPENSFIYSASSLNGIENKEGNISTSVASESITLNFKSNNIKKFGAEIMNVDNLGNSLNGNISVEAFTNKSSYSVIVCDQNMTFAGFNVISENEYITKIILTPNGSSNNFIRIHNITVGDNIPQNVALNFDGLDDHLEIPSTVANFENNQDFTISLWVKPDSIQRNISSSKNVILEKWDGIAENLPFSIVYYNQTDVINNGKIEITRKDGNLITSIVSNKKLNDGKWHSIILFKYGYDVVLIIDGLQDGITNDLSANQFPINNSSLFVGKGGNSENYFKGIIDEIRIYNSYVFPNIYCKTPNTNNLIATYDFNNGTPNGNNILTNITGNLAFINTNAVLNNFSKTGNNSNFITGQVKYVKSDASGLNNGTSWINAFNKLQPALLQPAEINYTFTCNDLIEVFVSKGTYYSEAINNVFYFGTKFKVLGGFIGNEININQRSTNSILNENISILSGDINKNDIPLNFTVNRDDNSNGVVYFSDTGAGATLDGFQIMGGNNYLIECNLTSANIRNCKLIESKGVALNSIRSNVNISDCIISGNNNNGINFRDGNSEVANCLITGNKGLGISYRLSSSNYSTFNLKNSTIAKNIQGADFSPFGYLTLNFSNLVLFGNDSGVIFNTNSGIGSITKNINNCLIQGINSNTNGNLNGNINPLFVNFPTNTLIPTNEGDYNLRSNSPCINVGSNLNSKPLDLDGNIRPIEGIVDIGAFEFNILSNQIRSTNSGNWDDPSTWNLVRIPIQNDNVIINSNHLISINNSNAKAKNVTLNNNSNIIFTNSTSNLQLGQ